jgi:hypothetical protein
LVQPSSDPRSQIKLAEHHYHPRYQPADGYKQGFGNLRSDGSWSGETRPDSFGKGRQAASHD